MRQTSGTAAYWHSCATVPPPPPLWEQVEAEARAQQQRPRWKVARRRDDELRR